METGDVEAVQTRSPSDITLKYKEGLERFAQTGNPEAWWFFNDDSYIDLLRAMDLEQLQTEKILKIYYENVDGYNETLSTREIPFEGPWPTTEIWNSIADRHSGIELPNNYRTSIIYDNDDSTYVVLGSELDEQPCLCVTCANSDTGSDHLYIFSCDHVIKYAYSSDHWMVLVSKSDLHLVDLARGTIQY